MRRTFAKLLLVGWRPSSQISVSIRYNFHFDRLNEQLDHVAQSLPKFVGYKSSYLLDVLPEIQAL